MSKGDLSLESELHVTPEPVLIAVLILGTVFFIGLDILSHTTEIMQRAEVIYLLTCTTSVIGWLLARWKPLASRWFIIVTLSVIVHLVDIWLMLPGSLVLVAIPIALAVPLIRLSAGIAIAVTESLLLVAFMFSPIPWPDPVAVLTALLAIWAMLAVMYGVFSPVIQLGAWLEEHLQRTQTYLRETQDRKLGLEQALESAAHANRQLALAGERAVALRAVAEDAQRAKAAFVANVSHEFRTPLNIILGLVDLMVDTPEIYDVIPSPKMREDLKSVQRNCEHLSRMINDVLDLTRVEAGRMALHKERVDLNEVVSKSVGAVSPLTEEKQLALHVAVPDGLPKVYCDRTRIQQVILNLLSNAARFTQQGQVEIKVVQREHDILMSVADTGPGIEPEDAERIFEPFWQGSAPLWQDKGGSGLGLSISKQFVEMHRGRMWLESEPGLGTTFFFTLPISGMIEHRATPGHQIRKDWVWREGAFQMGRVNSVEELVRPRVVLCDRTGALYPRFARRSDGVEFIDTRDPAHAVEALEACPAHLVMLNEPKPERLPRLVDHLKQAMPGTPIVGCCVHNPTERAVKAGALGYLIKPVTRADLSEAIRAAGKPVKRVLVVDDDPEASRLFQRMLHVCDGSLEVAIAYNGEEALDRLRCWSPDLVLLDVVMPEMNGWEVLHSMSQDAVTMNVPTYLISAQDPTDHPLISDLFLATVDGGLSLNKLLRCSLEVSKLLLQPEDRV
ncbi:MAG: ATP-binding protein [Anaerolineae bacterium]